MCIDLLSAGRWRLCLGEAMRHTRLRHHRHGLAGQVAPRCEQYADCGGCSIQDMAYPVQLRLKEQEAWPRSALPCHPLSLPAPFAAQREYCLITCILVPSSLSDICEVLYTCVCSDAPTHRPALCCRNLCHVSHML